MAESEIIFHLLYILLIVCILYPPSEFVALGLTIDNIFSKYLGTETIQFIQYQIRRTSLTLFVHSLIPIGYVIIYSFNFMDIETFDAVWKLWFWYGISLLSVILPIFTGFTVWLWFLEGWQKHPLCKSLKLFTNDSRWESIAEDINTEYRRHDKIIIKTNSIYTVIVTENWIIKTTPYTVYLAHQSDTALIANKSDTHMIGQDTSDIVQFVNIEVKPVRNNSKHFTIRINALDFRTLQDRIHRPIAILSSVQFNQTVLDRWIAVFKEQISLNPRHNVEANQVGESCFACMISEPNVKLIKNCFDVRENGEIVQNTDRCGNCYCRPMWCVDCMAKWFSSRQAEFERDTWLEQKCTCPMCRAQFCILDVSYIVKV